MAVNDRLIEFVREALSVGQSREHIRAALTEAGWSEHEIAESLASFATTDFTPPVPCPRPHLTARDTFIYLLLFASLGFVASYLVTLVHSALDLKLPSSTDSQWLNLYATRMIRFSIAVLVVSAPVFVWMTVYTRRQVSEDAGRRRSPARRWLTYLALLVAALVFLGDAVYVIFSFLNGEATTRFLLKALTVACVSLPIFGFYLHDIEEHVDER